MGAKKTTQASAARSAPRSIIGKIKTRLGINSRASQKKTPTTKTPITQKTPVKETEKVLPLTKKQIAAQLLKSAQNKNVTSTVQSSASASVSAASTLSTSTSVSSVSATTSVSSNNAKLNPQKSSSQKNPSTSSSNITTSTKSVTIKDKDNTCSSPALRKVSSQQKTCGGSSETKTKVVNKMLKNLDTKEIGFKDILSSDEEKTVECKASICEVVKTKYRTPAIGTSAKTGSGTTTTANAITSPITTQMNLNCVTSSECVKNSKMDDNTLNIASGTVSSGNSGNGNKTKTQSQTKEIKRSTQGTKNDKSSDQNVNFTTSNEKTSTDKKEKSSAKSKAKDSKNLANAKNKKTKVKSKESIEEGNAINAQPEKAKDLKSTDAEQKFVVEQGKCESKVYNAKKKKVTMTKKDKQDEENTLKKKTKKGNKAALDKSNEVKQREKDCSEKKEAAGNQTKTTAKKVKATTKKTQNQNQKSQKMPTESEDNELVQKSKPKGKTKYNKSKAKAKNNKKDNNLQKVEGNTMAQNVSEKESNKNNGDENEKNKQDSVKSNEEEINKHGENKGSKVEQTETVTSLPKKVSITETLVKPTKRVKSPEKNTKLSVREKLQKKYIKSNTFKSYKTSKETTDKTEKELDTNECSTMPTISDINPIKEVKEAVTTVTKPEKDIYDFKTESEDEDNIKMNLLMNETVKALLEKDFSDEDDKPLHLTKLELEVEDNKPLSQCKEDNKKETNQQSTAGNQKRNNSPAKAEKKSTDQNETKCTASPAKVKEEKKQLKSPKKVSAINTTKRSKEKNDYLSSSSSENSTDSEDNNLHLRKKASFGPKRMASLNALAKVQCLYENESRTAHELGLSKTATIPKIKTIHSSSGSEEEKDTVKKEVHTKDHIKKEPVAECEPKRELRNAPGLRGVGKHWDFDSVSDFESGHESDIPFRKDYDVKPKTKKRKVTKQKVTKAAKDKTETKVKKTYKPQKKKVKIVVTKRSSESSSEDGKNDGFDAERKSPLGNKRKREKTEDLVGDLKGILARKRIASLNASALVAATYDIERHLDRNLGSDCSSFESFGEDEKPQITNPSKNAKEVITKTESITEETGKDSGKESSSRPTSSSVVIVQDTDVTITGVYVNSTVGAGQEAYCKMQYRVQSSVTEERVLCPTAIDPPKSYTPLGALSSMRPPGSTLTEGGQQSSHQPQTQSLTSQQPSTNIYQSPSISEEQSQQSNTAHIYPSHHYHQTSAGIPSLSTSHHQLHQEHQQYAPAPPSHHHYTPSSKYSHLQHHHHPLDVSHQSVSQLSQGGRCESPLPSLRYQNATAAAYQSPIPPPPTISMSGSGSSAFCAPMQQSHHDITGYYQPAGPLISPHVLPPPPPGSAALVSTKQVASPLSSDPEQQLQQPPQSTSAADSSDSEVLITGGDLGAFRYSSQQPPQSAQSQQQLSVLSSQQQHPQTSAYTRSMHQMHYPPAYPPSYYSPYPGDAMCYSPPYQPYFPAKVYQSAPAAYRRYPSYYQTGPPPPPADLYDPPPSSAAPPPPTGSQLVPAGPTAPQHMEHYPGPPGFYSGYSPGGGQCYSRGMQPPYMDYPAPCPCPMQSCPKNVLTGPLIGSNNSGSNTTTINNNNTNSNVNLNTNVITTNNNNNNIISSKNANNTSTQISQSQVNSSLSSNLSQTLKTNKGPVSTLQQQQQQQKQHSIVNKAHNHILGQVESTNVSTNGSILGNKKHLHHHHLHQCKMEIIDSPPKPDLNNGIERKEEVHVHVEGRKNSQYEEEVVIPPTPPTSYTINDKLIEPDITVSPARGCTGLPTVPDQADKAATTPTIPTIVSSASHQSQMTTAIIPRESAATEAGSVASTNLPPMIGRKARIGKSMAREMMYGAHTGASLHHQHQLSNPPPPPPSSAQIFNHHHIHQLIPPSHNPTTEPVAILQEPNSAVILKPDLDKVKKEEIKTEEEDVVVILDDEKQDIKKIKTEPEIVEVFDDRIESEVEMDLKTPTPEQTDDLIFDDFKEPRQIKRMKILELNKTQCKKSPPNGYKSLIKQTEPKPYLCISRKSEKKEHFRKVSGKSGVKKRKLMLTEQQKNRLLIRKRKLLLMEKERQEQIDENSKSSLDIKEIESKVEPIPSVAVTVAPAPSPISVTVTVEPQEANIPIQDKAQKCLAAVIECGTAKGYSSEPDIRSSTTGRKSKKTKSSEVRSKSETKKPTKEAKQSKNMNSSQSTSENQNFESSKARSRSKEIPQVSERSSSNMNSDKSQTNEKSAKQKKCTKQNSEKVTKLKITHKSTLTTTTKTSVPTATTTTMVDSDEQDSLPATLIDRTINNNILETNNNNKLSEPITVDATAAPELSEKPLPTQMTFTPVASDDLMPHVQPLIFHPTKRQRSRTSRRFSGRKRRRNMYVNDEVNEVVPLPRKLNVVPRWNNGWSWEGEPFQGKVFLNSDDPLVVRTCYASMKHIEGDVIRPRDCVLLRAGSKKNELPYVAKVAHLWENPEDGEMMMSLLWYYRPEHTEQGRQPNDCSDEVFASRHRDHNSVACIEDKCYVLTFAEYCRYRRNVRAAEEGVDESVSIVPPLYNYHSPREVPVNTNPELVMFCQRVYEFRLKRLLKSPTS